MTTSSRGRPTERALTVIAVALTFASGASDVAGFTRLGGVFTSVMTGNMVVFGLSLARGSVPLATHTVTAFAGYVLGVGTGTRIGRFTVALLVELGLFAGVAAGWEATGSRPGGAAQFVLLVLAAGAMGIQSAAVNEMGLGNVSTTYLTGTLTGLVSAITRPARSGDGARREVRRPAVLGGLLLGAALAGVFVAYAPPLVPLLPLLAIATAALLASGRAAVRKKSR